SYAQVTAAGASGIVLASPSNTDLRTLQTAPGSATRLAASYYSATTFTLDVNLTDGKSHQVALYMLDWDSHLRAQIVTVTDAATGALLDARVLSDLYNGQWLVWNLSGHAKSNLTSTGSFNADASGLFFGPAAAATAPRPPVSRRAAAGCVRPD